MPQVVSFEDAKAGQFKDRGSLRTTFLKSSAETPDLPMAYMSQGDPGRVIRPHFHYVDQFQIIAGGKGKFGRHDVGPYYLHFSRAGTPYGPIVGDDKTGISFFTLRAHFEPRAYFLPESSASLSQIAHRQPWQITRKIIFPTQNSHTVLDEIPGMKDDQGLFAYTLSMAPNSEITAPAPSRGDGQFIVVTDGSLWYQNKEHKAFTVVFLNPADDAFHLQAGGEGLKALIMNFPEPKRHTDDKVAPSAVTGYKKWQCVLCAFAYDEAVGMPEDGIPAGTRWQDVPDSWTCPDCSASKSDFEMVEV